jgi:TolB-like protein
VKGAIVRSTLGWAFAVLASAGAPLQAQKQSAVIAVLPFEDRGSYGQDKEVFRALALGIPATLVSELGGHPTLRIVEPSRVTQAFQSQALGPNTRVDAATAAKVGKELGARYAVTGNFADFYGKFHLDARVVDTETGQILRVVSNSDSQLQDRADLYRIIQMVAHRVLAVTSPEALRSTAAEAEGKTIPTEALRQYSLGLLYESRGDPSKAGEHYQRALSAYPGYPDAQERMQRIR